MALTEISHEFRENGDGWTEKPRFLQKIGALDGMQGKYDYLHIIENKPIMSSLMNTTSIDNQLKKWTVQWKEPKDGEAKEMLTLIYEHSLCFDYMHSN